MERLVKKLNNNLKVVFDKGKFDNWCVFLIDEFGNRNAPKDIEYFSQLQKISRIYPENKVYHDFLIIYNQTTREINHQVLDQIYDLSQSYLPNHKQKMELWLTVLYAGMIAEENKEKAILKKRIKRLGMYQVLIQNLPPEEAASFSKGKRWRELNALMQTLGF